MFINVGPAFIILIIYIKIYFISKTHQQRLQAIGLNINMSQRVANHGNRKAEASVFLVSIGYFVGWMPFTICFVTEYLFATPMPIWATSTSVICFFINCSWNVFIYYWRLKPFRISAMKLLRITRWWIILLIPHPTIYTRQLLLPCLTFINCSSKVVIYYWKLIKPCGTSAKQLQARSQDWYWGGAESPKKRIFWTQKWTFWTSPPLPSYKNPIFAHFGKK